MKLWKKILKKLHKKEQKRKKKLYKVLWVGMIWGLIILWSFFLYQNTGMSFEVFLFSIYNYLQENMILWIIVFFLIYLLRILLFLPATPFEFLAAMVYWFWAFFIVFIALFFSISLNYFVWRRSKKYIELWLKDTPLLKKFRAYMKWELFLNILFLRLMPFPFDIGSFLCGVFRFKYIPYLGASILGALPSTFIFILAWLSFYEDEVNSFESLFESVDIQLLTISWFALFLLYMSIFLIKKYLLQEEY